MARKATLKCYDDEDGEWVIALDQIAEMERYEESPAMTRIFFEEGAGLPSVISALSIEEVESRQAAARRGRRRSPAL